MLRDKVALNDKKLALSPATGKRLVSLRLKGYLAYGMLTAFAVILAIFIFHQKRVLLEQFDDLQSLYNFEIGLHDADARVLNAIETQQINLAGINLHVGAGHVRQHLQHLYNTSQKIIFPSLKNTDELRELSAALERARVMPDEASMLRLGQALRDAKKVIEKRLRESRIQREKLARNFHERSDDVAMISLTLGLLSMALLGTIIGVFFSRLAHDLILLRQRGQEIIQGQRGKPVPIKRNDEVGDLANAINQMADDLDQHEKTLEFERRKNFHREKMAAMGTLTAGIAHEVGNPIAAISALVKEVIDEKTSGQCPSMSKGDLCKLHMVLDNANRLGNITREISGLVQPQSEKLELFDLNALIRNTCNLMRYDRRWKEIQLDFELDKNLPAVNGVSDQLTQVLMNLLVNALDALEFVSEARPQIMIRTWLEMSDICMSIKDNGQGMDAATLKKAKQEFFTTKDRGKGTGLGLSLCNSIIEFHHGQLDIASTPGKGTEVCVHLPLSDELNNGAAK